MKKIFKTILAMIIVFSFSIPANAAMNGIDVSSWQTGINTAAIDADFVICKATEGTWYVNPDCDRQYTQAIDAGKKVGVYHFADGSGAVAEADFFVDNITGYIGDAVLVLDWESSAVWQGPWYAKTFLDRVYERTGVKPMIYMSNSVVNSYDWSVVAQDYGLWNAGYYLGYTPFYGYAPDTPLYGGTGAWTDGAAMYQYTSSGYLYGWGGPLDLNVFYGDENAWDAYASSNGTPPAPNTPVTPQEPRASVEFTYMAQTAEDGWLPAVTNLEDYAGIQGHAITGVAITANTGSVWYQVCTEYSGWLPVVTGYDINDYYNGYAGNGQRVTAVRVYYNTPDNLVAEIGYQKAQYRVSTLYDWDYYDWQYDDEITYGQDGYAGDGYGPIDAFQLF